MSTVAMSGADTVNLNNRVFTDFAEGSIAELTFPNAIANVKTGKNGNSIYSLNESGRQATLKLRLIRGSSDDKFMAGLINQQQNNFSGTVLLIGQFIKKIGNGRGQITNDTYYCSGGVFTKIPEGKTNVDGEAEQSVVVYEIMFSNAPRTLT